MKDSPARLLAIDADQTIAHVADAVRLQVLEALHRRGIVVGLSGGVDSSVVAALSVDAKRRTTRYLHQRPLFVPDATRGGS